MGSFAQLLFMMESQSELNGSNDSDDTPSMKVIRTGLNISDDFWDDFIRITNNPNDLSDLLGVRPEIISGWASIIKENLNKVQKTDSSGIDSESPKTTVMDTGKSSFDY